MKLWIDSIRPAPKGYVWCKNINEAKEKVFKYSDFLDWDNQQTDCIEVIDINQNVDDYIKLLNWLEENGYNYPIHIHLMNLTGMNNG